MTLTVLGPKLLGHATDLIVDGVVQPPADPLRPARQGDHRRHLPVRRGVGARLAAVVHARRRRAAHDVPAAQRRRGQAQPPAAELRRPPAARRPAQPGHQRHRQHRPEPAADAQPDAHVGPHARRRGRHDVHHLAAAGVRRGDHRARVAPDDARRSPSGRRVASSRSGGTPGALNAQIEETFTGHSLVKVFGRQREVEETFREKNDELYEAGFRAQFIAGCCSRR